MASSIGNDPALGKPPRPPKPFRNMRIKIPSMNARLLNAESINGPSRKRRLLDFLQARPSVDWFSKIRISSPLAIFRRTVNEREEISLSVPSPVGIQRRFQIHFIRKIKWSSLFRICEDWLKHPMNIALLLWLLCIAASATMLGLLMLGLLNTAFPTAASRKHWVEVNNQILNALFTLMSVYQHPILFHHLAMLSRWSSEDIVELRKIYCKDAAYRPREWAHMMVVIALLHVTCLAQYALCGLYWIYQSDSRPELYENLLVALGIAAPVFAAGYTVYSPLGREIDSDSDEESQAGVSDDPAKHANKLGRRLTSRNRKILVSRPEWVGGLFDCGEDVTVGYLSFFCSCCVFGWNMERLGFGNMYVHIFTFLLLFLAPFWIFNITAMKIHEHVIGDAIGITGILLCVCGLLYGGFWRVQMRNRFKLPGSKFCCGSATVTDYFQWLFCWSCSLAQEVRTGNFYDVEDDSLYRRLMSGDLESQALYRSMSRKGGFSPVSPLSRSDRRSTPLPVSSMVASPVVIVTQGECSYSQVSTPLPVSSMVASPVVIVTQGECSYSQVVEQHYIAVGDGSMTPPIQPLISDGSSVSRSTKLEDSVMDGEESVTNCASTKLEDEGESNSTLAKAEDRASDADAIAASPVPLLVKLEDAVTGNSMHSSLREVEGGDGDTISSALIRRVDKSSTSRKLVKFVQIMQYGLFVILLYALGARIIR